MLALDLSKEIEDRLQYLVEKTGTTPGSFARTAILEKMEELEDMLRLRQALAESDGTSLSWEEAMKEWDLEE